MLGTSTQVRRRRHRADTRPPNHHLPRGHGLRSARAAAAGAAVLVALTGFAGTDDVAAERAAPAKALVAPTPVTASDDEEVPQAREGEPASRSAARTDVRPASAAVTDRVVMPLEGGAYEPTSPYGERTDPVTGAASMHHGSDMAAPLGTPIHAVADGVVTHVGPGIEGRSDMLIIVEHRIDGQTVHSWYNHMYADGLYVDRGQQVSAGEVIGAVGSNGKSTGPHLHLEIHTGRDTTTDPVAWLAEHGAVEAAAL